jgi:hypothetical protein
VHPPPSPARTNFTLITACTPESSGCNSVYSVGSTALYTPWPWENKEVHHFLLLNSIKSSANTVAMDTSSVPSSIVFLFFVFQIEAFAYVVRGGKVSQIFFSQKSDNLAGNLAFYTL